VILWLDSLPANDVAITAIAAAELLYGVERLPDGRRKAELATAIYDLLGDDFHGRVLPFDERAAEKYADLVAARERLGQPIGVADAQIAAICRAADGTLATRNTGDFSETGARLLNPWDLS
jgi:predicted nucleic acid-binding protein